MARGGRSIVTAIVVVVLVSGCVVFRELEIASHSVSIDIGGNWRRVGPGGGDQHIARGDYGPDVVISPRTRLPNEGRMGGECCFVV